jgi:hypothetical protein
VCIKHVSIINNVAWNIRNYRYVGDVSADMVGVTAVVDEVAAVGSTVVSDEAADVATNGAAATTGPERIGSGR